MAKVIVTGGAGYIGSHTLVDLIDHGHTVVSIDNYVTAIPLSTSLLRKSRTQKSNMKMSDLKSKSDLKRVFEKHAFDAVIHLPH